MWGGTLTAMCGGTLKSESIGPFARVPESIRKSPDAKKKLEREKKTAKAKR